MSEESNLSHMIMMGRSVLDLGRVPTLPEIYHKIESIDSLTLQTVAQEMFGEGKLSYLAMEPSGNGIHKDDDEPY
jgi:hypothetical protein